MSLLSSPFSLHSAVSHTETKKWQLHFSLMILTHFRLQAIEQHWSSHLKNLPCTCSNSCKLWLLLYQLFFEPESTLVKLSPSQFHLLLATMKDTASFCSSTREISLLIQLHLVPKMLGLHLVSICLKLFPCFNFLIHCHSSCSQTLSLLLGDQRSQASPWAQFVHQLWAKFSSHLMTSSYWKHFDVSCLQMWLHLFLLVQIG